MDDGNYDINDNHANFIDCLVAGFLEMGARIMGKKLLEEDI